MELRSCGDLQSSHGNIEGVILGDSLACMISRSWRGRLKRRCCATTRRLRPLELKGSCCRSWHESSWTNQVQRVEDVDEHGEDARASYGEGHGRRPDAADCGRGC